jgi:hypothetical protein
MNFNNMSCKTSIRHRVEPSGRPWTVVEVMRDHGREYMEGEAVHRIIRADVLRRNGIEIFILYWAPSETLLNIGDKVVVDGLVDDHFASDFKGYWRHLLRIRKIND